MQSCQTGPALNYDETELLCEYITKKTRGYGDRVAQIDADTGTTLTFKELHDNSDKLCSALINRHIPVTSGDIVAIITTNCIEYVWILLGVFKAKACSALLNPAYTPREIQYNFSVSQPKIVICSYAVAMCEHVLGTRPADLFVRDARVEEVWVWGCTEDAALPPKFRPLRAVLTDAPRTHKTSQLTSAADLPALILSSSGSTGLPKGVMLSNQALVAALHTGRNYVKSDEIALGLMPFSHAYGLVLMLMCVCEGACVIVMRKFAVEHFIDTIQKYKVSNLYLVPSLLALLSKHRAQTFGELSSVRHIWTGAAPVSGKLQERMTRLLGHAKLHHSYGMTETTFTMFTGECRLDKLGSPGTLTPGMECMVVSEKTGEQQTVNQEGELWFRGPLLMSGYKGNVEASREMIDNDGWLHSGDLGYYDQDGYFFVVDRLKELIKYQGHQVRSAQSDTPVMNMWTLLSEHTILLALSVPTTATNCCTSYLE